jgi:hypothetical protein
MAYTQKQLQIVETCNNQRIKEEKRPQKQKPICSGKEMVKCAHCDWEGTNGESFKHSETTGHTFYSTKKIEKE